MSNNTTEYKWFNYQTLMASSIGMTALLIGLFFSKDLFHLKELGEGGYLNYLGPIIGVIALITAIVNIIKLIKLNMQLNSIPKMIFFSILSLIIGIFIAITAVIDLVFTIGGKGEVFGILRRLQGKEAPVATGAPQDAVMDAYYESQNNNTYATNQAYTENQEKAASYAGYSSAQEADKAGKLAEAEGTYESSAEKMLDM